MAAVFQCQDRKRCRIQPRDNAASDQNTSANRYGDAQHEGFGQAVRGGMAEFTGTCSAETVGFTESAFRALARFDFRPIEFHTGEDLAIA